MLNPIVNRLNIFRHANTTTVPAGHVVFNEGDLGQHMYAIVEGSVEIREGDILLDTLGAGDYFGEMALIDKSPRSATAIAKTETKLAEVDLTGFQRLVAQTPYFALDVMSTMAERIRRANARIAGSSHKHAS